MDYIIDTISQFVRMWREKLEGDMKPETKKAMLAQPVEIQQEIISMLADAITTQQFVEALEDADGDWTESGAAIAEYISDDVEGSDVRDEITSEFITEADRLHEAICEGRKQDAIDILNAILPEAGLRPAHVQNDLFPNRVEF